jgi:hypothetical protein
MQARFRQPALITFPAINQSNRINDQCNPSIAKNRRTGDPGNISEVFAERFNCNFLLTHQARHNQTHPLLGSPDNDHITEIIPFTAAFDPEDTLKTDKRQYHIPHLENFPVPDKMKLALIDPQGLKYR